jgi:hypothetical protein
MRLLRISVCALAVTAVCPAQPVVPAKAGVVTYTEGKVFIGDRALEIQPVRLPEMKEAEVLRTESGRAEVLLAPCVALRIGENSGFRMLANALSDTRIALLSGSAVVDASGLFGHARLAVLVKQAEVVVEKKGLYHLDADPPMLRVYSGIAMAGGTNVAAGHVLSLDGASAAAKLGKQEPDPLDEWSRNRARLLARASGAARQQDRQAQTLGTAADKAANTEASIHDPGFRNLPARQPPPPPMFPSPARASAFDPNACAGVK